jgi:hypothetical protein
MTLNMMRDSNLTSIIRKCHFSKVVLDSLPTKQV